MPARVDKDMCIPLPLWSPVAEHPSGAQLQHFMSHVNAVINIPPLRLPSGLKVQALKNQCGSLAGIRHTLQPLFEWTGFLGSLVDGQQRLVSSSTKGCVL